MKSNNVQFWINEDDIEEGAKAQLFNLERLPFTRHVAVMPDIHQGYGMPIGVALATDVRVVVPNAVGVDIGCGMCVTKLDLNCGNVDHGVLADIRQGIVDRVPVGRSQHVNAHDGYKMPDRSNVTGIVGTRYDAACYQLGTLGGGNHFIEIQRDDNGVLYIMIHSGSRNLGHRVATHYNDLARKQNKQNRSVVDDAWELAFFDHDDPQYHHYLTDMEYCIEYAAANRKEMAAQVIIAVCEAVRHGVDGLEYHDICHNMAGREYHMGKNLIVHRKGVAGPYWGRDRVGIIPGSMGTKSYLVKRKDDAPATALCSTSHGAGRKMSRKRARNELDLGIERHRMMGIHHGLKGESNLDEAPGAYKDVDWVIAQQRELLDVVATLTPVINVKG